MKVIVIGCGLSGLTAAYQLNRAGHDVVVLEAKDRVGGRTWSAKIGNTVAERGAEFISRRDFAVAALAAEFRIPVVTHGVAFERRELRGHQPSPSELESDLNLIQHAYHELADGGRPISFAEVAQEALGESYLSNPTFVRLVTSLGGSAESANALNIVAEMEHGRRGTSGSGPATVDDGRYLGDNGRLLEGNQSLALAIAKSLGSAVRLNSPVMSVEQSDGRCEVTLHDGTSVVGDAVIVTVPLPMVTRLNYGFDLPEDFLAALSHLEMGVGAKLAVDVGQTPVERPVQAESDYWWYWKSLLGDAENQSSVISCFASGASTIDSLQTSGGPEKWWARLSSMLPAGVSASSTILTDWQQDPWTRGVYSYAGLEWKPSDVEALNRPVEKVVFAGEHTGLEQTMNGAILSGQRAAKTIMAVGG